MPNLLFVCSRNKLRSATAETMFSSRASIEAIGAGIGPDSPTPLSGDLIEWADIIFVMEQSHKKKLTVRFRGRLKGKRVVVLGIRDRYQYMDPRLVSLLETRVGQHVQT